MLYARWQQVARDHADAFALGDQASGRRWTFAQLAREAETFAPPDSRIISPCGNAPEFILTLLAAWRTGRPALPLEAGQSAMDPAIVDGLPSHIAHLKLTSGTTGASRLILFTADQLAADAANIVATMGLRPDQPNLGVISLAHSYGFSSLVTPLLLHGIPLILGSSPMPEAVKVATEGHPSIALPAVPAMWRAWHEAGTIPANVQLAISAGAPLPLTLETGVYRSAGLKLHNFYGSSECGGIAYDATTVPRPDAALAGSALRGVELSLGDNGCLVVAGAAVGTGYWPDPSTSLGGGRFQTSDLAEFDGIAVRLCGRSSDVINVAGRKLAPETVEGLVRTLPGVRDCVVFGVPARDPVRIEEVAAAISLRAGQTLDDIVRELAGQMSAWQLPRHWWEVPEITANERGKVSRREWRERFLQRPAV